MPASGPCFNIGTASHELGHAFGLAHDFRNDSYLMSYGGGNDLSPCDAGWLDAHRAFNSQFAPGVKTSIEMLPVELVSLPNIIRLRFKVTDPNGLNQAFLRAGWEVLDCEPLYGKTDITVEFVTSYKPNEKLSLYLDVINAKGIVTRESIELYDIASLIQDRLAEDVNADGLVDVEDLLLVAASFGLEPPRDTFPATDVNADGEVNEEDVALVLAALEGSTSAAPALDPLWMVESLQRWIAEFKRRNLSDPRFQRGISVLEMLLAAQLPQTTVLSANYPNPFNPETWLPYALAESGQVTLRIYSVKGALVRTLDLGHQPAGRYHSKSRAAYWEGRNDQGEPVASGVYFYTLTAGDFTATRKMLMKK